MLELRDFGIWLPGPNQVIEGVTLSFKPGEIWAVVGRSGSGSSALLRAVDGRLPRTARQHGTLRRGRATTLHLRALPPVSVADFLGGLARDKAFDPAHYGAQDHLRHRTTAVPPDVHTGLLLASLHQAPPCDLILVDACLTAAAAPVREAFGLELRRRAEDGATILWADHDLETLTRFATHVLELGFGRVLAAGPCISWIPRSLPTTGHRSHPTLTPRPRAASTIIPASDLNLTGAPIELRAGACLGIVRRGARPEPIARRIVEYLDGEVASSHLGRDLDTLLTSTKTLWLPHAQAGLDPHARRALIARLAAKNPGPRLLTGRDDAFLAEACHEFVLIDGDKVRTQGTPTAMSHRFAKAPT